MPVLLVALSRIHSISDLYFKKLTSYLPLKVGVNLSEMIAPLQLMMEVPFAEGCFSVRALD